MSKAIHLVGFGSQGTAWAECLRQSKCDVRVYLGRLEGKSFERATALGFNPQLITNLASQLSTREAPLIAMLCPDHLIDPLYREFLAAHPGALTLVLAHGYAVYASELKPASDLHELALLAPKAIGPKLRAAFVQNLPETHSLVAAFRASKTRTAQLLDLARGLGFSESNLVHATFEEEAIGDLISEQGLLCGGIFTLLEWTLESMAEAGIPDALIREECLTELELVAGLLKERGPASTFAAISPAAQCGALAMRERFENAGTKVAFQAQIQDILTRKFTENMKSPEWKKKANRFVQTLEHWEQRLRKDNSKK